MMPEWYSPSSITKAFTKGMVIWLIPLLPVLRDGLYPPNPKETGYIDPGSKQRRVNTNAHFEKAADISIELTSRLKKAGLRGDHIHDGMMLEHIYTSDPDDVLMMVNHLASAHGISVDEVYQRVRQALYYVSGRDRKIGSYTDYLKARPRGLRR